MHAESSLLGIETGGLLVADAGECRVGQWAGEDGDYDEEEAGDLAAEGGVQSGRDLPGTVRTPFVRLVRLCPTVR